MTRLAVMRIVCACTAFVTGACFAAPPADLDRYARRTLEALDVPGMTVAIVEQGRPSVVRSYGVRKMGESAKVDEHTLFAIGSTTKAFTTALLAMLVDEGKLTWDTKVADVLPDFKMYDPYVSSEMTVCDIVVHRSGLGPGAGDLLFYPPTSLTRAEIIHRLRFIKPVTSFRSGFAYDNLLYIAAGEVIATVENSSWEDVVRKRILTPLQMNETTTTSKLPADANRAWPHARVSTEVRGTGAMSALAGVTEIDVAAAAGALNSNGAEIARWLELQSGLDHGGSRDVQGAAGAGEGAAGCEQGARQGRSGKRSVAADREVCRQVSRCLVRHGDDRARWRRTKCSLRQYAIADREAGARAL